MKNIYLCGPTVYSEVHIGNMRPIVTFDIYNRSLSLLGEDVFFIHNITDIDDKIITKAIETNSTEEEVANKYTTKYLNLLKEYNVSTPNEMPTVTSSIKEIISFIEKLVDKGSAYQVGTNVYFDVENAEGYGELSNRSLSTMKFEEKGEKKHPGDFALWKETDKGIKFDSPWGPGRPGWHTECSLFVNKYLNGESLDIHGGGIDLLFPHHENEDAQYKAINNKPITKEWRHVGHLMLDDEKMSKSIGNVFDAEAFAKEHGVDTFRYLIMSTAYSAPMNINDEMISSAKNSVEKFEKIFNKAQLENIEDSEIGIEKEIALNISKWNFSAAMKDVHQLVKQYNENPSSKLGTGIIKVMNLIGFNFVNKTVTEEDKALVKEWEALKKDKNYEAADKLREVLKSKKLI